MAAVADIRTYVINLRRRPDRRKYMEDMLPDALRVEFTSDWDGPFDGLELTSERLEGLGIKLFPWPLESDNPWWNRPLKFGEIGCTLSHIACWERALGTDSSRFLILEDDASFTPDLGDRLMEGLDLLERELPADLVYLGRHPLEPDEASPVKGVVYPGYSHCSYAYVINRRAVELLLSAGLHRDVIPLDEFLPAMYLDHPRPDVRRRFPKRLTALAFDPPLVLQLPKESAGSDTEDSPFVST